MDDHISIGVFVWKVVEELAGTIVIPAQENSIEGNETAEIGLCNVWDVADFGGGAGVEEEGEDFVGSCAGGS